jgi:hypothetical protein
MTSLSREVFDLGVGCMCRADLLLSPLEVESGAIDTSHLVPVSDHVGPITRKVLLDPSYGHGSPRDDAPLTKVTKVDPQTGNAIQIYGPPGCDLSLPMIGDN